MPHPPLDSRTLGLLGLCAFASMASMRVCDAMLPSLVLEFSTTTGQAARAISGFALAYGVLQLFYGPLGDRHGKARVVGFATLACTIGCMAAALSPNLDWLVAARVFTGMAAAGIIPLTMAWIGDGVAYEARQEVLARLLGATVFGMICGQWLGGLIAELWGWRSAFAVLALIFLVSGAMLTRLARGLAHARPADTGSIGRRVLDVLSRPWARTVLVITCIEGALAFSAMAFIPTHLHAAFHLTMPVAGAIVALYGVGGLVYSRYARALLRRFGETGLAGLGGSCMGLAFVTVAFAPSWAWALPACLVAGFGFYALHNTLQTHATQMSPAARGTAVSLFACVLFLGQSLGVLVAAWVVDRFSSSMVFAASALGLLLLGGVFAFLVGQRDGHPKEA
ncbi:arabinose ABC transporter permease [Variovorax sp. WS11]|uniref:MFS transporter n=1 Tax=Variovorax sp. WS11 TaxID=1105204 RepID=UPI000D0DE953|nr:MFS transporter [Variovorax sp. WS11]NDZ18072.1 MFS transporter [Variovorax sp. WS11]PSL79996.1 arabinose ABC transporter permease [Variovorax sp. WS11]